MPASPPRPRCIASVRVAALRASGLQASAARLPAGNASENALHSFRSSASASIRMHVTAHHGPDFGVESSRWFSDGLSACDGNVYKRRTPAESSDDRRTKRNGNAAHNQALLEDIGFTKFGDEIEESHTHLGKLEDLGPSTQTAAEAIGLMMYDDETKENSFHSTEEEDIGPDTQMAVDAIELMMNDPVNQLLSGQTTDVNKVEQDGSRRFLKYLEHSAPGNFYTELFSSSILSGKERTSQGNVTNSKESRFGSSLAVVPRRKRSPRSASLGSLERKLMVFWQDERMKVRKIGFVKRIHPQIDYHKDQKRMSSGDFTKQEGQKKDMFESITDTECYNLHCGRRKTRKQETNCISVLFSHSLPEDVLRHQKKILRRLGGRAVRSATSATHFVADSFFRTRNMLECMASGKHIVTTLWLQVCDQAHYFVDERNYILKDSEKEKELGFCMHSSLAASRKCPLLKGMKLVVSPNTVPNFEVMSAIIKSAGGQAVQNVPTSIANYTSVSFVVASEGDFEFCVSFIERGIKVYSAELILQGIIVQHLDFTRNHIVFEKYCK